jgi:hypothetical protein
MLWGVGADLVESAVDKKIGESEGKKEHHHSGDHSGNNFLVKAVP